MAQAIQLVGAFLILIAYALAQLGMLSARGVPFLLLNLAGAIILAGSAYTRNSGGSSCSRPPGRRVGLGLLARPSAPATG